MRHSVFSHFDPDVSPTHLVSNCRRCGGTQKRIQDEITILCSNFNNALQ